MNEKEYREKWKQVQEGKLTEQEWKEYCMSILSDIIEQHREVFERLAKND